MATQHYQEQEQDDLMAAFDAPPKEAPRSTLRRRRDSKNVRSDFDRRGRKDVNKPKLKTNFYQQAEVPKTLEESPLFNDRANAADEARLNVNEGDLGLDDEAVVHNVGHKVPDNQGFSEPSEEGFSSESFNVLLEEIQKIITKKADELRNVEALNAVWESIVNSMDIVYEIPKLEEESKIVTALALAFYGGSWTMLAGIIGAVEVFGTQEVFEESLKVGNFVMSDDYEENDVTPLEVKETFRKVALQIALMIAVVTCPSFAEICITIAFACKFSSLVSAQEMLKKIMVSSEYPNMEIEDYFGLVDPEWFDLLSLFGCNIVSVILFGCFPRLITATYMGYLGVWLLADTLKKGLDFFFIPYIGGPTYLDESMWMRKSTQYYVWTVVAVLAVWQAMYGYSGYFEFISWSMFLYPAVRVHNYFFEETKWTESKKMD